MRMAANIVVESDEGTVIRVVVEEAALDRNDRVLLANLLHAVEMRTVAPTAAETAAEEEQKIRVEADREVDLLRRENAELRQLVAQIPPGSMIGVPPPPPEWEVGPPAPHTAHPRP